MSFLVLGLNHRTAPLELRERLAVEKEQLGPSLEQLRQYAGQGVVLSTCNRLEVYSFGDANGEAEGSAQLRRFLSDNSGVSDGELAPHLYSYQEGDCVRHLFRVAAGLDSMVVGERQILGQVRSAFSVASQQQPVGGPLSRLFHQALRAGRRVHRETAIGGNSRSVSRAAVELARRRLGDLASRRVLVIGAGDAGRLVAQALADAGARQIVVTNRTHSRAEELARDLGGVSAPFADLPQQLIEADVVISSTGAPGYVLDRAGIVQAVRQRDGKPLLLIDIAVPRDIDPDAAGLPQVQLYDIDALQSVAEVSSPDGGLGQDVAHAERIVAEETERFLEWWRSMDAVPVIAAVRQQAEALRHAEVERTLRILERHWRQDGTQPEMDHLARRLDAMTTALVNKLLHYPTVRLKEMDDTARQELARQLFNLDGDHDHQNRQ
ncbi:MAG: glutamyl-tRNA reductase [SAR202 cluster bacterium]|nr:glutamyl-tRNA reductase [SAR202 cluster bacterium]